LNSNREFAGVLLVYSYEDAQALTDLDLCMLCVCTHTHTHTHTRFCQLRLGKPRRAVFIYKTQKCVCVYSSKEHVVMKRRWFRCTVLHTCVIEWTTNTLVGSVYRIGAAVRKLTLTVKLGWHEPLTHYAATLQPTRAFCINRCLHVCSEHIIGLHVHERPCSEECHRELKYPYLWNVVCSATFFSPTSTKCACLLLCKAIFKINDV